jgi:hypothetical protein
VQVPDLDGRIAVLSTADSAVGLAAARSLARHDRLDILINDARHFACRGARRRRSRPRAA